MGYLQLRVIMVTEYSKCISYYVQSQEIEKDTNRVRNWEKRQFEALLWCWCFNTKQSFISAVQVCRGCPLPASDWNIYKPPYHLMTHCWSSCCNYLWPICSKSWFREEQPRWTWWDLSWSQTLFIWWIHLLGRFERFQTQVSNAQAKDFLLCSCSTTFFLSFYFCVWLSLWWLWIFKSKIKKLLWLQGNPLWMWLHLLPLARGNLTSVYCSSPLKQAVTANPPPSLSNPRQSWANPKLIFRALPAWCHTQTHVRSHQESILSTQPPLTEYFLFFSQQCL